jgi:hypothetical protein
MRELCAVTIRAAWRALALPVVLVAATGCASTRHVQVAPTPPTPLCADLFRSGAVVSDAQWQAGCRIDGAPGVRPSPVVCKDGRYLYDVPMAWGYGGEPVHVQPPNTAEASLEYDRCVGAQTGSPTSSS